MYLDYRQLIKYIFIDINIYLINKVLEKKNNLLKLKGKMFQRDL